MLLTKIISLFLCFCLILEQGVFAQTIDLSRYFANSGKALIQSDKFRPLHLRYISYDTETNDFQILLDKGDFFNQKTEKTLELEETSQELMKYFFIGLALPNEKFWVNLRPDSPDNILDPDLEKTDIGRIFLEADLRLKKDTSGMTSPQTPEGKTYWDKLYKKAGELFGSQNITIPTITRPWIVPAETIIGESPEGAYIYKATLKVMLEEDYLTSRGGSRTAPTYQQYAFSDPRLKELNEYSTHLIKETIIPKLTYEVNTSKRYAPLRQVYYSLILAQWFKQKYSSSGSTSAPENSYIDLIDSGNLVNLTSKEPYDKQTYFKQYQKSFADGEYNLQEPVYTATGQVIRRYVSGGVLVEKITSSAVVFQENNQRPIRDYLIHISNGAASPLSSVEETAKELTEALFNPNRANERLFLWEKTLTPKILKQIVKNINTSLGDKEHMLQQLILRIIIDSAEMKNTDDNISSKPQNLLFSDIVNGYVSEANKHTQIEYIIDGNSATQNNPVQNRVPDQLISHIREYFLRFGSKSDDFSKLSETAIGIKAACIKEGIAEEAFMHTLRICYLFYEIHKNKLTNPADIKQLIESALTNSTHESSIYTEATTNLYLAETWKKRKELISYPRKGIPWESNNTFIKIPDAQNLLHKFDAKIIYKSLYILNSSTGNDLWIIMAPDWFSIGWFDNKIQEFLWNNYSFDDNVVTNENDSGESYIMPDGNIDLSRLTNNEGVKRLLASSSAAAEMKEGWEKFQHSLNKKGFSLPDFRKRELPLETHEFIKELQIGKLRIMFFVLKKNESQFHSYEFYLIDDKPIGYGINELKENNTVDIAMHIFKENRGIYSKDIWEHRLDSLLKIYNDAGIGNKKIKSLLVRPSQFSYSQPYGDIAEGPRALIFYLKKGFRPEAPDLYADINKILQKLENGGERDELFKEAGDDLLKVGINRMLLYLPIDNDKGGIDFHALPIETRQIDSPGSLAGSPLTVNPDLDFEGEWRGIQMVFNSGIRPSARRLAEFAASASASPGNSQRLEDLRGLVTDLLRRDEENEKPVPAERELKELIVKLSI